MEYQGHGRWSLKRLPATPAPKGTPRLKKITYKPEYDDPTPAKAKKKPAKKKATTARRKSTTTKKPVVRQIKQLPAPKKRGWLW